METTFDSVIEKYNEKNEFITKIWVWIAIISIFGILIISQRPRSTDNIILSETNKEEQTKFPIIDISVPSKYFVLIYSLLLTGLIIRWVEAFSRSATLRQRVIEPLIKNHQNISIHGDQIDSRSLLDGIVYSTTTSIWGIVPDFKNNTQKFQRRFRSFVYVSLKIIVFIAHFFLPLAALFVVVISSIKVKTPPLILIINFLCLFISVCMIIRAAICEWQYSSHPMKEQINKIQGSEKSKNQS